MNTYQVIAKRFRPKKFSEIFAQEAIVQTIKNAIRMERIGHAYLFCGTRGTGKTTLARLFAKAMNCINLSAQQEPCNACQSCTEINRGGSLDVIEIDGASNRGIDDIRNLNETVGYAASNGKYKIYIIDEVHMLTKEAFNALLKTLEEPPSHVCFFLATTEPHKVLATITSRCQRFDLQRIPPARIEAKLSLVVKKLSIAIEPEALQIVAKRAEGSLRDAESLLDQLVCFGNPPITRAHAIQALGLIDTDFFFKLDRAASKRDLAAAFSLSEALFLGGAHLQHVLESLAEHFRIVARTQLGEPPPLPEYIAAAKTYSKHQVLDTLDYLVGALEKGQSAPFKRIHLEIALLRIIQNPQKISLNSLVERLEILQKNIPREEKEELSSSLQDPAALSTMEEKAAPASPLEETEKRAKDPLPSPPIPIAPTAAQPVSIKEKIKHEQVLRFASIELNGSLKK